MSDLEFIKQEIEKDAQSVRDKAVSKDAVNKTSSLTSEIVSIVRNCVGRANQHEDPAERLKVLIAGLQTIVNHSENFSLNLRKEYDEAVVRLKTFHEILEKIDKASKDAHED